MQADDQHAPVKDLGSQHPVAGAWRPALREIVKAFVAGDFSLAGGIASVASMAARDSDQIRRYIADFGETLIELPDEAWASSAAQWMESHWDVLVDLWTEESGRSDMVLSARVSEAGDGYRFEIHTVYVP